MVLIHDFTIVKQYGDKLLKQQQNIPSNRCHIAYIKFAMAVLIIDESVFALRWNQIIEKNANCGNPIFDESSCLHGLLSIIYV